MADSGCRHTVYCLPDDPHRHKWTVRPAAARSPHSYVTQPASLLVLFGATGDLAQRMLLPSLYGLHREGLLHGRFRILGSARSELDSDGFRRQVAEAIERHVPDGDRDAESLRSMLQRIDFHSAQVDDATAMARLAEHIGELRDGDVLCHLSTAPRFYGPICDALSNARLADPGVRVLLEKPIGRDLASSIAINDAVAHVFAEERVFRVDHYLGKEGVQNLLALRFGNALFEPLWNARHIEQVQITVAETVGVEGRGDYYDDSGALRDMVQNHMLQLLCLTAMEPPSQFEPTAVRNEKIKVLRSLRPIRAADVATHTVAGQYGAGAIAGQAVPGYIDELGRKSGTETFVAVRAHIDNWRWSGVPFYMRSGKKLARKLTEVFIQFKRPPVDLFRNSEQITKDGPRPANRLVINIAPNEGVGFRFEAKVPGSTFRMDSVKADLDYEQFFNAQPMEAYGQLLLDAMRGDKTLFKHRDEVEHMWRIVQPVLGSEELNARMETYAPGTWGPKGADAMMKADGRKWHNPMGEVL